MQQPAAFSTLERYVPRIATNWDRDAPGRRWQTLDATLCFVDISGFTNLSEKLERNGRIGAEELTGVLNFVFGRMLELSYSQGGSLLKFGGDALLLLFTNGDHAARAASAAVEMRSALRDAASFQTSVGKLRLRMSVGIHSGSIHLFRVGGSHDELVIAGPGGTKTTEMEKAADPGEIVVSSETRERLGKDAAPKPKGDGWILKWRKAHGAAPGPVAREAPGPGEVSRWVPVRLRDYLKAGDPEPEHRIATVGFIRFCGIDERIDADGPEAVAEALNVTISAIQDVAEEEGVTFLATDINEDGGKVILAAGAPEAQEGDEGRILRTVRRISDSDTPLDLHVGINRGHVFTGEVGTKYRSTYTVMGDTVNLSARLMAAAPAGAIYATPTVLDQSGTLYGAEALDPLHVKGKENAVLAYGVGEELGERSDDARADLPFVGRSDDLDEIASAIADARDGTGSVVMVIGETGVGKSRLVSEASAQLPGVPVMSIHGEPYGAATPYRPFRDPMRSVFGIRRGTQNDMSSALTEAVRRIDADLLPMLPLIADVAQIDVRSTPEASAIEPRFRMDRLADAVMKLLDQVLTDPTVVLVEDAQWMDEASTHLLAHFTASADERPWAIVVTRRDSEGGFVPPGGRTLKLDELTPDESEELVVEATKATPLRPHEMNTIVARGGGNPLFLAEILRVVKETGSTDELPDSLGTLVSSSIDALPPLTRRMLRYCAVLGRSFRVATMTEILAEDDLELNAATRQLLGEFLEPGGEGRLRFRTAMVRDVAYDGLSFRRRREIHQRAAAAIEKEAAHPEDSADQLAMHYSFGGNAERTWHYARIAGDRAARSFANVEAVSHYERALESVKRLPDVSGRERGDVWSQLGEVKERAGLFDESLDAYRKSSRLMNDDPVAEAEILLKRAFVRWRAGQYPVALSETTRAKHLVRDVGTRDAIGVAARATAFAAHIKQRQEKPHEALKRANEAIMEAEPVGEKSALARAYSVIAWAYLVLEDPGALELTQKALRLYEDLNDLVGQQQLNNNLGVIAYFDGRWSDALGHYERSMHGSELLGNIVDVGTAEANIGEVLVNQFRLDEAEPHLRRASRTLRASDEAFMATFAELQLGRLLTERGDLDEAEELLERIRAEGQELGYGSSSFEASLYLAECIVKKGHPQRSLEVLDAAVRDSGEEAAMYEATETRIRVSALSALGLLPEALELVQSGLESARQQGLEYDAALMLKQKANLLRGLDAGQCADCESEAAAIFERYDVRDPAVNTG